MKRVQIITDGSCWPNPGPGGWAAVLLYGKNRREISGSVPVATNNRMELQAAIEALSALNQPCEVEITSDSEYLVKGFYRNQKQTAKNFDLWIHLKSIAAGHNVTFKWVRGHDGHPENERCDVLAGHARLNPSTVAPS